jgi:hypothetical protein
LKKRSVGGFGVDQLAFDAACEAFETRRERLQLGPTAQVKAGSFRQPLQGLGDFAVMRWIVRSLGHRYSIAR